MRHALTAVIISLVAVSALPAQEWALERLESVNDLRQTTEQRIDEGFTPVSLDISEDLGLTVLYARLSTWAADTFAIEEIPSLDLLNDLVTTRIRDGWFPMDFSFGAGTNALLFTSTADVVDGWRLISSPASTMEVQSAVAGYRADGFTPVGISALDNGQMGLLFLSLPEREALTSIIVGMSKDPEEAVTTIQSMVDDGWTPVGVTTTASEMVVLFLQL